MFITARQLASVGLPSLALWSHTCPAAAPPGPGLGAVLGALLEAPHPDVPLLPPLDDDGPAAGGEAGPDRSRRHVFLLAEDQVRPARVDAGAVAVEVADADPQRQ